MYDVSDVGDVRVGGVGDSIIRLDTSDYGQHACYNAINRVVPSL